MSYPIWTRLFGFCVGQLVVGGVKQVGVQSIPREIEKNEFR